MAVTMSAFKVLMWKHYMVRRRRWLQTLIEFFTPISLLLGLFILKDMMHKKTGGSLILRTNSYFAPNFTLQPSDAPARVYYAPETYLTRMLMQEVDNLLGAGRVSAMLGTHPEVCPFGNVPLPLLNILVNPNQRHKDDCAIVELENMNGSSLPNVLEYTIRMNSLLPRRPTVKYQRLFEKFENEPEGFLSLQWAIDSSFIKLKSNSDIQLEFRKITFDSMFNTPKTRRALNKTFVTTVFFLLPYISFAAPLLPFIFLMNRLLEERGTGIQELVKMVGVTPTMLNVTQFVNSLPPCLVFCVGGTILLKISDAPLLPATDATILFLSLFLHFTTIMAMAFACSYIVRNAQFTVSLSMFVYIGMWVPIRLIGHESKSDTFLFFLGLCPHCPCYWFLNEALIAEVRYETGVQFDSWTNRFARYPNGEKNACVLVSFIMQLVQIIYFFLFSSYLEKVRPGRYGIALPWNFFCQKEYWRKRRVIPELRGDTTAPFDPEYQKYFEDPPSNMEAGITISHVSKIFGSGKKEFQALNNVTLNIYKGEITVLLGHNGAGKTTLMSIVTGMINPTSGKVYVNGMDTVTQQADVRRQLGLCPQHNLFFPDLTVREHLTFFSMIKGGSFAEARKSSSALMDQLSLMDHTNKKPAKLSGGLLRRLQLGCALCGDANVLILDEPTSGLDVEARRELWDMLLGLRGDRTLVLTTHFMEEADVLGDRIAALHAGKLRCHATPMYLKRAVGSGFRISITTAGEPDEDKITKTVQQTVSNAILKERSMKTVVYDLPVGANLPALFSTIENKKEELEVESLGVGITTLEEVFLQLCCDVDTELKTEKTEIRPVQYRYITGFRCTLRQMQQLFRRQLDFTLSKKVPFLLLQVLMPFILCPTLTKLFNNNQSEQNQQLLLNLDMYSDTELKRAFYNLRSNETLNEDIIRPIRCAYPTYLFMKTSLDPGSPLYRSCSNCSKLKPFKNSAVGFDISGGQVRILYSPNLQHSASVGLNLVSNVLAMESLSKANGTALRSDANAKVIITKLTNSQPFASTYHKPKTKINCALFSIFNMCTLVATAINDVSLPCKERLTVARHTHIMAGCPPALYWLTTFLYHMTYYTCFCCTAITAAAAFFDDDHTIDDRKTLVTLFVTVFICGMNFYAFCYLVSFYFNERGSSILLIAFVIVFGYLSPILIMALDDLKETEETPTYTRIMNVIGVLIPPHLFTQAIARLTDTSRFNSYCSNNRNKCPNLQYYSPGFDVEICCGSGAADNRPFNHFALNNYAAGSTLIIIAIQFACFSTLVLLLGYGVFNRWWNAIGRILKKKVYPEKRYNCPQVAAEKAYVNSTIQQPIHTITDTMLVNNAWKTYYRFRGQPTFALRDANFSVKKGECFGVLGVNGAGKTTTFKLISREESATEGKVFANGYFIGCRKYLNSLGYCPQFSGLDDFRTGTNNLRMLLTLRGLSEEDVKRETVAWLTVVGMEKHGHREVSGYSGGMVRRLATAASLCGGAAVTMLDEPTAGVDTAARRLVWAALKRGLLYNRAIVISSHSMDEMEKLCTRVTILSSGEMSVLGSPLALKDDYAAGHTIVFKLHANVVQSPTGKNRVQQLKETLHAMFNCSIKDEHLTSLHYRINEKLLYSDIFSQIEDLVHQFEDLVEDYSVADTTLEDVFLTFANEAEAMADSSRPTKRIINNKNYRI